MVGSKNTGRITSRVITPTSRVDPPSPAGSRQWDQQLLSCQSKIPCYRQVFCTIHGILPSRDLIAQVIVAVVRIPHPTRHCMCDFAYWSEKRWRSSNVFTIKHCLFLHRTLRASIVELITGITKVKAVIAVHIDQPLPYRREWFAARWKV
jgi:hypothetical protein